MSKLPSMPFLVDKYLADTTKLTLEEHGAYCLLIMHMWKGGGFIDDDDTGNARTLGVTTREWAKIKVRLSPFLIFTGGRITQKRVQEQWNWAIDRSAKQAARGKKGGLANAEKLRVLSHVKRSISQATATPDAQATATAASEASSPAANAAYKISKNIPTTSQEDRGAGEDYTSIHRLLQTPAMRKTA
jgi:uncharacterized protein YdaU (DUF1376 family)